MDAYTARFGGIARLYGADGLEKLRAAHVCVVGIGGVGSWTAEALARSGVGNLTLIDLDEVCLTNTNRQIHALKDSIGKAKVQEMDKRIRGINPDCTVETRVEFFTEQTSDSILATRYDYVVDAIDGVSNKSLLLAQCRAREIPVITCGAAGGRRDSTAVCVVDLARAKYDRLFFNVRNKLRQDHGFPRGRKKFGIMSVYSAEPVIYPQENGSSCEVKPVSTGLRKLNCEGGLGAATQVTGAFGFAAAGYVVRELV